METFPQWFAQTEARVWVVVVLVFLGGLALSAWVLNLSCGLCRVQPPGLLKALVIVVCITLAGGTVTIFLNSLSEPVPMWVGGLCSFATVIGVLCVTLPTDPFSALLITIVQSCVWVAVGLGLTLVGFVAITAIAA